MYSHTTNQPGATLTPCGEQLAAAEKRITKLERALDDLVAAHELPGTHCELEKAVINAKKLLLTT